MNWDAVIAALEAHLRTSNPDIPSGVRGFERALRKGEELADTEMPHAFAHNPTEDSTEDEVGQLLVGFSIQIDLWARGESQKEVAARAAAFRDRLRDDRRLGGLVEKCYLTTRAVREFDNRSERAAVMVVLCEGFE